MTLYVSNSTTQHVVFFFREEVAGAKEPLLRQVRIDSGRQTEIGHGWAPEKTAAIVKQLEVGFGARDAAEVYRKLKKFAGVLYRVDGQISADEIMLGHDGVKDMQNERSVDQALNAALAADRAANPVRGQRRTKRTEVEVTQIVPPGKRATGDETSFALAVDAEEGRSELVRTPRA